MRQGQQRGYSESYARKAMLVPFIIISVILWLVAIGSFKFLAGLSKLDGPDYKVTAVFVADETLYHGDKETKLVTYTYDGQEYTMRGKFENYHTPGEKITVYLDPKTMKPHLGVGLFPKVILFAVGAGTVGFWIFAFKRMMLEGGRNIDWNADRGDYSPNRDD